MNKKLLTSLLCFLLVITAFTGCGVKLTDTSIYVHKDGSLEAAVYEAFDSAAYDEAELTAFLEETVIAYNQVNGAAAAAYAKDAKKEAKDGIPVAIDAVKVKNGVAILEMTYASCEDYMAFNVGDDSVTTLISGAVSEQKELGCDLNAFTLVDTNGESYGEALDEDARFVVVEGNQKILVEGKIVCVSKGVSVEDKKTAVVTPEAGRSVIVFSK